MWQGWSTESGEEQTYIMGAEEDLDNVDLDNGYRLVNPVVESLATQGLIDSE